VTDDLVHCGRLGRSHGLHLSSVEDYVTLHEVENPGLERHIPTSRGRSPGAFPELERNVMRRKFFANFDLVTGLFIYCRGLPRAEVLEKPMFARWTTDGWKSATLGGEGGRRRAQFKYKRAVKEAYMPEAEIERTCGSSRRLPRCWKRCIRERIWNSGMHREPSGP